MKNKKKTSSRFWIISGLLHGTAAVVLILTPAGQRVFKQEDRPLKPEIVRKDEALAEVIDDIRDLSVVRLKAQLALLEAGRDRMATNFDTMNRHYQPFVAGQISSARARLLQEGEKTLGLQQEILAAAREAVAKKEQGSDAMWRVFDKNRAALIAGQEEIRRVLLLTAAGDPELLALQDQAEAAQMETFRVLSVSVGAQNHLWNAAARLQKLSEQKAELEQALSVAEAQARELESELERLKVEEPKTLQELQDARQRVGEAKKNLEKARREKSGEAEARATIKQAEDDVRSAQKIVNTTKSQRAQMERKLKSALNVAEARKKSLAKVAEDTTKTTDTLSPKETERDTNAAKAAELQEQAMTGQTAVYQRLLAHLAKQAEDAAKSDTDPKEKTS